MHFLINNSNLQGTYLNWYHFLLDYHRTFGNTNFLHISKYVNKLLAMFIEQVYLQINSKPLAHLQFYTSKTPLRFPFSLEILYVRFSQVGILCLTRLRQCVLTGRDTVSYQVGTMCLTRQGHSVLPGWDTVSYQVGAQCLTRWGHCVLPG